MKMNYMCKPNDLKVYSVL